MVPFVKLFPRQGAAETRTITMAGHHTLPDDEYALVELYCADPTCDCRRVMLNVVGHRQMKRGFLASISFGFDREGDMAGPFLDPLNYRSKHAETLLGLVGAMLETDHAYVARLERHYQMIKQAAANPTPYQRRVLGDNLPAEPGHRVPPIKRPDRNAPCPCGSGKKYKYCCMRKDQYLANG
jgi:hypothetical protein